MPPKNKGKSRSRERADGPTERSPLIDRLAENDAASSNSRTSSAMYTVETPVIGQEPPRHERKSAFLVTLYSVLIGVIMFAALFIVALGISFLPNDTEKAEMHEAFVYSDPRVDIINVSESGIHLNLTLVGGIDMDRALSVDGKRGSSWWQSTRRGAAHLLFSALPTQEVYVTLPEVMVYAHGGGLPLLNVTLPGQVVIPLGHQAPLAVEALANPIAPAGQLWKWGQKTWESGTVDVVVCAPEAKASIPGAWWSRWVKVDQQDLSIPLTVAVPEVPNLPPPGHPLDLSKLVKLDNYSFSSSHGLKISASASLPNPSLRSVPFALPFSIQIGPDHETIAMVVARASKVTSHKIGIDIEGDIVALESGDALSQFLQNYLQGDDNPITVRGLGEMPKGHSGSDAPPPWVLRSLPSLQLHLVFPSPKDRPDVVREVTIEQMRLGEANGQMIASGTVVALIELPDGMERVALNVSAIKPDVMVHDGPTNADVKYDPSKPPPKAFGRIWPNYHLNSTTARSEDPKTPHGLVVRAPFKDMPLDVLPGRDSVMSDFITKVIFKGGATAGIAGIADVKADIGVGGTLDIGGLPVHGEFWVGRGTGKLWKN